MGCCGTPRTLSPMRRNAARREETILQIPNASVHLMQEDAAGATAAQVELARGDLAVVRITEEGVALAAMVRVGADLRWPLTKDEPVVKLDPLHYLFTLPCPDGGFLNYGVSFSATPHGSLPALDAFLKENACFSVASSSSMKRTSSSSPAAAYELDWKDYSPRMEDYNGVLAKAIAEGTGGLVKGIFMCSNAYTSQARGREAMISGFYHGGYENALLMLMRRRRVHSGLVVKGEEGALSMTTKARSITASKGLPVNHCSGFRSPSSAFLPDVDGISRESFSIDVNAEDYGFEPTDTPRTDRSVSKNIELGLAALRGEKGPAYDRIILNAGMVDHLLGCTGADDVMSAFDRAREAIDSGKALKRLTSYIQLSHKVI